MCRQFVEYLRPSLFELIRRVAHWKTLMDQRELALLLVPIQLDGHQCLLKCPARRDPGELQFFGTLQDPELSGIYDLRAWRGHYDTKASTDARLQVHITTGDRP